MLYFLNIQILTKLNNQSVAKRINDGIAFSVIRAIERKNSLIVSDRLWPLDQPQTAIAV